MRLAQWVQTGLEVPQKRNEANSQVNCGKGKSVHIALRTANSEWHVCTIVLVVQFVSIPTRDYGDAAKRPGSGK